MTRMTIARAVAGAALILILAAPAAARAAEWRTRGHAASAWDDGWRWLSSLWEEVVQLRHAKDEAAGPAVADGAVIVPTDDSGPTINPDGHRH